jgi:charged multivesicular body protein 2A
MDALFGKPKDAKEVMREQQRDLKKVQRELDRDRVQLERQEKDIMLQIRKAAKEGNTTQAKALAKNLIRVRSQQTKNLSVKGQISAVGHRVTAVQSQQVLAKGIGSATKAMAAGNKAMNLEGLQKTAMEFDKQNQIMDMTSEMFEEAIDGLDESEEEEESENVMNQILEEIGIDAIQNVASAPSKALPTKVTQLSKEDEGEDLMARLEALKRV